LAGNNGGVGSTVNFLDSSISAISGGANVPQPNEKVSLVLEMLEASYRNMP